MAEIAFEKKKRQTSATVREWQRKKRERVRREKYISREITLLEERPVFRDHEPLTREERRAKVIKKITSSKEEAKKFLIEVGILDKNGKPSKIYYP